MRTPKIIDTNVPLTAVTTDIAIPCRLACVQIVNQILKGEILVLLDENGEALREYRQQMYPDPNPSAGLASQFLMYLLNYQFNVERVRRIALRKDDNGHYLLFPQNESLAQFDLSDRKWVAIAIGYENETDRKAPIVNATDSDWLHFEEAFQNLGVQIEFLCKSLLKLKEG